MKGKTHLLLSQRFMSDYSIMKPSSCQSPISSRPHFRCLLMLFNNVSIKITTGTKINLANVTIPTTTQTGSLHNSTTLTTMPLVRTLASVSFVMFKVIAHDGVLNFNQCSNKLLRLQVVLSQHGSCVRTLLLVLLTPPTIAF